MTARKPRLPEYPRPVSPVSADEIPICDDTIVYYDQRRGLREDEEQRAAKRRRIESYATAYLRGQPLFILSAQLRGPFDDGWKNPWAKKESNQQKESGTSQPNPARLTKPAQGERLDFPTVRADHETRAAAEASIHVTTGQTKDNSADTDWNPMISSVQKGKSVDPHLRQEDELPSRKIRVEDWLRTNVAYRGPEKAQPHIPPSSPSDGKAKKQESRRLGINLPLQVDAVVGVANKQDLLSCGPSGVRRSEGFKSSFSSPANPQTLQIASQARDCYTSPPRGENQDIQVQIRNHDEAEPAKKPYTNESRAEYAILKSKREAANRTSSVADRFAPGLRPHDSCDQNPVLGAPQSGLKSQLFTNEKKKESEHKTSVAPGFISTSGLLPNAQGSFPPNHSELGPHFLTKETAISSMTTDLPSAQVPPLPVLASLPSDLSSHGQVFHEALDHCNAEAVEKEDVERAPATVVGEKSAAEHMALHEMDGTDREHILPTRLQDSVLNSQPISPMKAKGLGTSPAATDRASVVAKSIQKAGRGSQKASSPVGVMKGGMGKNKRRQVSTMEEILAGSSRGSIKSALKVAKPTVVTQDKMAVSKTAMPHEEKQRPGAGDGGDGGDGQLSAPNNSESAKVSRTSAPKSILKSSLQSSMIVPFHANNPGSSSSRQDAQRQQLLKLVGNDDDFDLDAAIDDLGSFLGTWDAEKEAFAAAAAAAAAASSSRG